MELEGNLPGSLVEAMNDLAECQVFNALSFGQGKAVSPGLAVPDLRYSKQLVAYIPSDGVRAMNDAISSYVTQHPFDLEPASCSWEKVLSEMDNAQREYEQKGKIGAVQLRPRSSSGFQHNLTTVLDCIPTDNGLGILKAGLAVIFNAVKRRSDACQRIFKCFSSVPSLLEKARDLKPIYEDEPRLDLRLQALYKALFQSIPDLIDILLRQKKDGQGRPANGKTMFSKVKKTLVARRDDIFGDPVKKVDFLVEPINKAVADLDECVQLLNYKNAAETNAAVNQLVESHERGWEELRQKLEATDKGVRETNELMARVVTVADRFLAEQSRKTCIAGSCPHRSDSASPRRVGWSSKSPAAPVILHHVHQMDLINAIASHRGHRGHWLPMQQMRSLVSKGAQFGEGALGRAYYLLSTPAFKRWISHASPAALLVEGHALDDVQGSVSPLSVFCAALAASLHDAGGGGGGVLFFACRLARDGGELGGPLALARSLLGQLLTQRMRWRGGARYPRLDFLRRNDRLWPDLCGDDGLVLNGVYGRRRPLPAPPQISDEYGEGEDSDGPGGSDDGDLKDRRRQLAALLYTFKTLVRQLSPDAPLYIVLDDAAAYETEIGGWHRDVAQVARYLFGLCAGGHGGPPVKLLATAPGRFDKLDTMARDRLGPAAAVVGLGEHTAPSLHSARSTVESLYGMAAVRRRPGDEERGGNVSSLRRRRSYGDGGHGSRRPGERRRASDHVLGMDDGARSDDDGSDGDGGDWQRPGRTW
ncbi:hypothetical protein RB597_003278 [Gaeumannomyces tritici]